MRGLVQRFKICLTGMSMNSTSRKCAADRAGLALRGNASAAFIAAIISPYLRLCQGLQLEGTDKLVPHKKNREQTRLPRVCSRDHRPEPRLLHAGKSVTRSAGSLHSQACPLRSNLPGVAPVHLPSWKVSTPLTMIE